MLSICFSHLLSCAWYFVAATSENVDNWLNRYKYADEALDDRYWASMYYIYATFTTTGYGDIVPKGTVEFAFTIIIMCMGVTFYSFIYSQMMGKLESYNAKTEFFTNKQKLLAGLRIRNRVIDKKMWREMKVIIDEHLKNNLQE